MDLRSLRYFCEVAACLSFSRAAEQLNRSQPALSRCIRELEEEMGVRLFERTGRSIMLTAVGHDLLQSARALLENSDAFTDRVRLLATGGTAILRVGGAASVMQWILPDILKRYAKLWPNVETYLVQDGGHALLAGVEKGEIDVALTRHTLSDILDSRALFPVHLVAVLPKTHRLAARRSINVAEMADERTLVAPIGTTSRTLFDQACAKAKIKTHVILASHELNVLVALAAAGIGVAVVPTSVNSRAMDVRIVALRDRGEHLGSWTSLVWNRRRSLPAHVQAFMDEAVRQLAKDYPGRHLRLPPLPGPRTTPQ